MSISLKEFDTQKDENKKTSSGVSLNDIYARVREQNETDRLYKLQKQQEQAKNKKEEKTFWGTLGGGLQLFGQGALHGLEGLFVDLPTAIAASTHYIFGGEEGKKKYDEMMEFASWDLTNMLINEAGGQESNPYLTDNVNLYNKEYLNPTSLVTDENLGGQIIQAGGNLMTGAGLSGGLKAPMMLYNTANAYTGATSSAIREGADATDASLYGLSNAGTVLLLDALTPNTPGVKPNIGKLTTKEAGKHLLRNTLEEAGEEALEQLIDPLLQTTYKGKDALKQYGEGDYWQSVLESAIVGGALGGAFDLPTLGKSIRSDISTKINTKTTQPKPLPTKVDVEKSSISDDISNVSSKKAGQEGTLVTKPTVEAKIKSDTSPTVNETVSETAKKQQKTANNVEFTKDEQYAVNKWVGSESYLINEALRDNKPLPTVNGVDLNKVSNDLSSAISKLPSYEGTVYRSIPLSGENLTEFINKYQEGNIVTENTYTSAAVDDIYDDSFNVQMEIQSHNAKDTTNIFRADEQEVLFDKGTSFKVLEMDASDPNNVKVVVEDMGTNVETTPQKSSKEKSKTVKEKPKNIKETQETKKQEIKKKPVMEQIKDVDEFAEPTDDAIDKAIDKKIKADEKAKKQSINKPAEKKTFTKEEMDNRKKFLEAKSNSFDREISRYRTDPKKLNEWLEGTIKVYDNYISDGGEPIQVYDDLAIKHHVRKTTENTPNPQNKETFTKKLNESMKQINTETKKLDNISISGNTILDEQLSLNEQYEFGDNVLVVQSNDSVINETYNEQQNKLKQAENPIRKALNKDKVDLDEYMEIQTVKENYDQNKVRKENTKNNSLTYFQQKLIDQYASMRKLDKQTKSHNVENALLQSLNANSLAAASINGDYIIDDQYKATDIPSIRNVFKPLIDMGTDNYAIAQQYILLQMDYFNKINNIKYTTDIDDGYVNNIFPDKTTDNLLTEISLIEESNPDLISFVDSDIIPNVRRITRALNQMEIRAGTRNAKTNVTVEFAKNEMNLSDEYIKNNTTKNGYVNVDTVDYWSAANPWYIPISRETGTQNTGVSSKTDRGISKPKGRKEGAEIYNIQPLADGFAEKYLTRLSNIQQNKLRIAIANATEQINGVTAQAYKTKQGETSFITTVGDGQTQLRYLTNDQYGNLVNKVVAIDQNIADAYNGLSPKITGFKDTSVGKVLNALTTIRRSVLTKYNIPWQIKNVVVDFGDAIINNEFGVKGNALLIKNEMGALFIDAKKNDPIYNEFMSFRGEYLTKTQEKGFIKQDSKGIKGSLSKVDDILQSGELMTRYAVYKTARQLNYSISDAQRLSNSATTDFGKTGLLLKASDTTGATVFLSTSMAGANRFYDSLIAPTVDAATLVYKTAQQQGLKAALNKSTYDAYDQRTLNRFIGQTIKTSLIFGLGRTILKGIFDDEEKQEAIANLSDSEIRDNICIPLDGNSVLKIPKGRIWRSMDVIQDLLTDSTIRDTDKMGLIDTFNYVMDNVGVNNLEDSLTISTTMDIIKNKDYFDNEIYDTKGSSKEKAKSIADYYAKQYGSWIYKAVKYANGGTEVNPFVSTFYTDTTTVQSYNNRFFNMQDAYSNSDDVNELFKYKVANYERTYGELGSELKILKTLKNDPFSTTEQIRNQEEKVKALYNNLFTYIDSNNVVDTGNEIRIGTNYTYVKQSDGTYKKKSKK